MNLWMLVKLRPLGIFKYPMALYIEMNIQNKNVFFLNVSIAYTILACPIRWHQEAWFWIYKKTKNQDNVHLLSFYCLIYGVEHDRI